MIKDNTYEKTETILWNYNRMKKSVIYLQEKLNKLVDEKEKLAKTIIKSKRVVLREENQNYYYTDETLENSINELKQLIIKTKAEISFIDKCISELKDDEYYEIISMWYFKGKREGYTREKIAEYYDCDVDTVTRNRKRLINKLKFLLFAKDSIHNLIEK